MTFGIAFLIAASLGVFRSDRSKHLSWLQLCVARASALGGISYHAAADLAADPAADLAADPLAAKSICHV